MEEKPDSPPTWKELVQSSAPLLLPAAHDALTARLIERAGFKAYQVGGFAVDGARFGLPDLDLTHYGDKAAAARDILASSSLPVLVDADDGYGDAKNVTRTVRGYEALGASAIFLEDQVAPKHCGHMSDKKVVPAEDMAVKVRAAVAARQYPDTFILARTDAREPEGLDEALRRAELYLQSGADGVYIEGPKNARELKKIGKTFAGVPLAVSILEGGGKTPWMAPTELHAMGFSMILYPTTVLFRVTKAIERALSDLLEGKPMPEGEGADMKSYLEVVGMPWWEAVEKRSSKG